MSQIEWRKFFKSIIHANNPVDPSILKTLIRTMEVEVEVEEKRAKLKAKSESISNKLKYSLR